MLLNCSSNQMQCHQSPQIALLMSLAKLWLQAPYLHNHLTVPTSVVEELDLPVVGRVSVIPLLVTFTLETLETSCFAFTHPST